MISGTAGTAALLGDTSAVLEVKVASVNLVTTPSVPVTTNKVAFGDKVVVSLSWPTYLVRLLSTVVDVTGVEDGTKDMNELSKALETDALSYGTKTGDSISEEGVY